MLGVLPSWFAAPSTFYKPLKIDIVRDKIKFAITKAFNKEKKTLKQILASLFLHFSFLISNKTNLLKKLPKYTRSVLKRKMNVRTL